MAFSVDCVEEVPFNNAQAIQSALNTFPHLAKHSIAPRGFLTTAAVLEICAAWDVQPAGAVENEPVHSDIPTLILAGEFDPTTPTAWSRLAASTLSRSYYYEFPGASHGVTTITHVCPRQIRNAFLDNPAEAPDTRCMAEMRGRSFVTGLHLNKGIYRLASQVLEGAQPLPVGLLTVCLLGLVSGAALIPLRMRRHAWNRSSGHEPTERSNSTAEVSSRTGERLAWLAAVLDLGFAGGLGLFLWRAAADDPYLLLFGLPAAAAPLFVLPWIALLLALAALFFSRRVLSRSAGSGRSLALTLLPALAVLAFSAWLFYFGLLP
jgi:hypothetical protein